MSDWPLLSLVIFLPLAGAGFILMIRGDEEVVNQNAKAVALWTAGITFLLSLMIWGNFDNSRSDFQLVERYEWLTGLGINYHVGVDGISLFLVLLSTLTTLVCIGVSWESVQVRVKEYMVAFLVMETFMVGVFCALDFVLFYIFFEGILIPMFLIIGVWGGPNRIYSAFKFFLYTLLGSVLFLVAILVMYLQEGTTDIPSLMTATFDPALQKWLWLAMFASFAVKVPMWPFHTWLPDAHVEAPTAGSVVLAGVLLKLGGYGFLRFSLPMLPEATAYFTPLIYTLSIVAVIYTSLVALMQTDMKKLIAYSSVAHMGIVTIGIFTLNPLGIQGSIIQMLSHGLVSAGAVASAAQVVDDDRCALFREQQCVCAADAAAGAGDQRYFSVEHAHVSCPL
jgi:NADH-quinone oxidoreductase subunit M